MKKLKFYIGGQMSGIKDHNFPAFFLTEDRLIKSGNTVINPAKLSREFLYDDLTYNLKQLSNHIDLSSLVLEELTKKDLDAIWEFFLKRDVKEMLTCDAVFVLDGWKHSKGATFEVKTALTVGMKIYEFDEDDNIVEVSNKGMKFGTEKPRWDLVMWREFEAVVRVLTTGADKYSDNNWQQVDNAEQHYSRAMMGHAVDYLRGYKIDDGEGGSGESHLANLICNALFLMWFDNEKDAAMGSTTVYPKTIAGGLLKTRDLLKKLKE